MILNLYMFLAWQVFIWVTTRKWVKRVSLFSIFILEFYRAPSLGELVKKVHILHVNTHLWARKWLRSFLFVLKSTAIIFRSRLEFQLKHSPWIFFKLAVSLRSSRPSWTFGNNVWEQWPVWTTLKQLWLALTILN